MRLISASLAGRAPLSVVALAVASGACGWMLPALGSWLQAAAPLGERLNSGAGTSADAVQQFLFDGSWVPSKLRMLAGVAAVGLLGLLRHRFSCRLTDKYAQRLALSGGVVALLGYGGLLINTLWGYEQLPAGHIPNQDRGWFFMTVQLPDAAALECTQKATDRIQQLVQHLPGIEHVTEIAGESFTLNANGSYFGQFFISFKRFEERREPSLSADAITHRVQTLLDKEVAEAQVTLFTPPPVSGLGSASGFKIIIEDRNNLGIVELQKQVERLIERSRSSDKVANL